MFGNATTPFKSLSLKKKPVKIQLKASNKKKNVDTEREGKTERVPILQKNITQIQREMVRVPSPDLEHRCKQKEKSMGITTSTPLGYISATIRLSKLAPVRFSLFF